jgi:hypothetical protein
MARRGAALVAGAAGVWLLAGPLGLVLAAALVAVVWLEVYTDAGLGS